MKNIITILAVLFVTQIGFGQNYDDLKILYADENYEKLVKVAEKYTEGEKTKKDVLPYIWLAKGLYKISLSGSDDERFKNAYKDAIKFLGKGMKYDIKLNDGATLDEHREFIDEFQLSLYQRISNELEAGAYKKAYSWAVKYKKISQNLVGMYYVSGACKFNDSDKSSARTFWTEGEKLLEEVTDIDSWSEADRMMFKLGIIHSALSYKNTRQMDKAKAILNKAAQWFEEDEDWQTRYDEIVNS